MFYDGFYCYFFSTCQIDCQGDLIVHFTMFMSNVKTLQQKVSLYAKWFHWILSEFISCNEHGLVNKQWSHWSNEWGLMKKQWIH